MYFKKEHLSVVANAFLDKSIQTVKKRRTMKEK